ncbi:putative DNA helicase INO80 [Purpureocillium lavendulum]|uniref:DNA helicase INO80 n=1 Tax=Purpureocillium lavendulum TaxID=1247861 RepID=A0AB34FGN7_9HYPO|nr:putative DNA helicase INO80 [Purpureocillium lavendulum]
MFGVDTSYASLATIALGLVTFAVALRHVSARKLHPDEPTVLPPWIPFVGHLLGMALEGSRYIKRLGLLHASEPIFTLPVPGSRIYVVTEPSLAALVQRSAKTLSFTPLVPDITQRVLGLDKGTVEIVRQNLDPEPGGPRGFLADVHDLVYGLLGPGEYLSSLSCVASQELCLQLDAYATSVAQPGQQARAVNLLAFVRHIVTVGTARYLYGPRNPIAEEPELEGAFWDFDHGLGSLMIGIWPSLTASKAFRGREAMVAALTRYIEAGYDEDAEQLVKGRMQIERDYGFSTEMIARSSLSFFFAGVVNTTTTTFWVALRVFADAALLNAVRLEVEEAVALSEETTGPASLSIGILKDKCVTLLAVLRESLRIGSENFSVRLVKEDMRLGGRYFLRKGSVVQIAGGVIHADKTIWGDDVDEFNPQRFLAARTDSGIHPAAFRGFGGGKTLCPGRHFATTEIMVFAALIVHSFDMSSPDGGTVRVPVKNDRVMPVHVLEPRPEDCPEVVLRPRDASPSTEPQPTVQNAPKPLRFGDVPNKYEIALSELQELESEPLCHRIAARLLVNNCQLLDGRDEATILTDSGKIARDFVDSFAASLAICDLERGSFRIPSACAQFRESALAQVPAPVRPRLHVSPGEVDNCLEGLAQSDSAWNTWVSYRHKALRFCEAARADNERDQHIHVFERITKILANLTEEVELELELRLQVLDTRLADTTSRIDHMAPHVDDLKDGLLRVKRIVSEVIARRAEDAAATVKDGLEDARNLQQLLAALLATVLENESFALAQQNALQTASYQANTELSVVLTTLQAAAVSSISLQQELLESKSRADEIIRRQEAIETGMETLAGLADALTVQHDDHQRALNHAQETAEQVLGTLESVSSSAGSLQSSILGVFGMTRWWPYLLCPVTTLIVGSYGLPPSAMRNVVLLGLGEAAGVMISAANHYASTTTHADPLNGSSPLNRSSTCSPTYLIDDITVYDSRQQKYFEAF